MTDDLNTTHKALEAECNAHKEMAEELRVANEQVNEAIRKLQRAQSQVVRQERLLALRQVSSGIMRDFNESLTPITCFGSSMKEKGHLPEHVDKILNKPYTQEELWAAIAQLVTDAGVCA